MKNNLTEARFQFLAGVINENESKELKEDGSFRPGDPEHQKAAILISNFLLKNVPQYMSAQDAGKLLQYMGGDLETAGNWQRALSHYSKD